MGDGKRKLTAAAPQPEDPRAAIARAVDLLRSGRLDQAQAVCEPLFDAALSDPEALHHLGYLAIELGQSDRAVGVLQRAIGLQPDMPYFYNTLGIAFHRLGRQEPAIEAFQRVIALAPALHEPFNNLGNALLAQARYADAAACYRRAAQLAPQIGAYRSAFAEALSHVTGVPAPDLRQDLAAALVHSEVDPRSLVRTAVAMVRSAPQFGELCHLAERGELTPASLAERHGVLEDPLLFRTLESAIVADAGMEELLTQVRRTLLETEIDRRMSLPLSLEFVCALARQCFATEYAWAVSADEERLLAELEAKAVADPAPAAGDWERSVAILGAYRPLHAVPRIGAVAARRAAPPLQGLLRQQVLEPAEEAKLEREIPAIHPIEDSVSRAVRAQYEHNPYPRWVRVGRFDHARPLGAVVRQLFPLRRFARLPSGPLSILIAGCGTGSHSVRSALRFEDASILAVDLSRASLAHAVRKTRELGIRSIEHAQADLLRLRELDRKFQLIECVGVLHHLRDPVGGWRALMQALAPGGFMRIGLYSELGRSDIAHGQAFARQRGHDASEQGIRALRQDLFAGAREDPRLAKLLLIRDSYSISGCRDLLLHVQEHRFTLPRIATVLRQLELEFLGFELPGPHVALAYRARFPSNPALDDLSNWHAFEQAEPETFSGMYQFWVRHRR